MDKEKNIDIERSSARVDNESIAVGIQEDRPRSIAGYIKKLLAGTAEARGAAPVPVEERLDENAISLLTLWTTANCSLLPLSTGMSGPLFYGLDLDVLTLVIIFGSLVFMLPIALLGTIGPKTGLRQIIQSRYYFGRYIVNLIAILQLATLTGYAVITSVVSGQTLAAVSHGSINATVGIVITIAAALVISFMGYKTLHYFENYSWIPSLIAFCIAAGLGGQELRNQGPATKPAASAVFSFLSLVASLCVSWAAIVSDFSVYVSPKVPLYKTCGYVYIGYCLPSILLMVLGAAIGEAVPQTPSWQQANDTYAVGGVLYAMVESTGAFGRFVAVLLAFSVVGNTACSLYSISISMQSLHDIFLRVPRYVLSIIIAVIVVPVSIVAASSFYASLSNFLAIIGYWTAMYAGIALVEHFHFRSGDYSRYDLAIWDTTGALPTGFAALAATLLGVGIVVPTMRTAWYVGPIAKHTGDIGIETGMVVAALAYLPFRKIELRLTGR